MFDGKNIRKWRTKLKLTQEELAIKLHVDRTIISKWENNVIIPSIENLQLMSKIFGISLDKFLNEKNIKFKYVINIIIVILMVMFLVIIIVQNLHLLF